MLKLMIIDDEKLIREGLVSYIDWYSLGIEVCMTFGNAVEALERIGQQQPDIVLSDIRMPEMNGIEMLKAIKAAELPCEVIFISAYRDFDYAREAIKYGAFEYLLKPIEESVLAEAVSRCVAHINKAKRNETEQEQVKQKKQKESVSYFISGMAADEDWKEIAGEMGITAQCGAALAIIRSSDPEREDISEQETLEYCRILELFTSYKMRVLITMADHEMLIFSFGGIQPQVPCSMQELSGKITATGIQAQIGICSSPDDNNPRNLYSKASWALLGSALGFSGKAGSYEELKAFAGRFAKKAPKSAQFSTAIKSEDYTRLDQALDDFFLALAAGELIYDVDMVKLEIYRMFDEIFLPFADYPSCNGLQNMLSRASMRLRFSPCKSILSIHDASRDLLNFAASQMGTQASGGINRLVNSAIGIIQKDLSADISLENVAKQLFINPNYLSRIFSSEMSQSFSHYRAKMRIERACELLASTNYKIYEIASLVGYNDVVHFTKVFSSFESVTPSEYRDRNTL